MSIVTEARTLIEREPQAVAGAVFVVTAAGFSLALVACAAIAPGYNVGADAISDLGVIPETAPLFNAAIVLTGLGNALGGVVYYRAHRRRWLLGLFFFTGLGSVGVGLFPADVPVPHYAAALVAFVALNAQTIACSRRAPRGLRALGVLAGVAGFASLVRFVLADAYGPLGYGGVERMVVYPALLWLLAFGGALLGSGDAG
jgi:hypothetical membrane protein